MSQRQSGNTMSSNCFYITAKRPDNFAQSGLSGSGRVGSNMNLAALCLNA